MFKILSWLPKFKIIEPFDRQKYNYFYEQLEINENSYRIMGKRYGNMLYMKINAKDF